MYSACISLCLTLMCQQDLTAQQKTVYVLVNQVSSNSSAKRMVDG